MHMKLDELLNHMTLYRMADLIFFKDAFIGDIVRTRYPLVLNAKKDIWLCWQLVISLH